MSAQTWTLTIPAPAPWLNLNTRADRRGRTADRRAWRNAGKIWAHNQHLPKLHRAQILVTLHFTDRRRRDPHNYMSTVKALVDGLVDYGLLPDDSSQYLIGPDLRMGEPLANGRPWGALDLEITDLAPKETS